MDMLDAKLAHLKKVKQLELFHSCRQLALTKLFKEFWYDKALNETELSDEYIPKVLKEEFQIYIGKRNKQSRYDFIMFTINFKEGVNMNEVLKKLHKYHQKAWIDSYMTCFEWRDIDKGMHVHSKVWISPNKNPYECKREVYNTFKHLVGNKMHINVRYSNRPGCFEDYIHGFKNGKLKPTHDIDLQMRNKHTIPNVITNLPVILLKGANEGEKEERTRKDDERTID